MATLAIAVLTFTGCASGNSAQEDASADAAATVSEPVVVDTTEEDTAAFIAYINSEEEASAASTVSGDILKTSTELVNFREKPDSDSEIIDSLTLGTEVEVLDRNAGWCKVIYDGQEGYINAAFLEGDISDGNSIGGIVTKITNADQTIVIDSDGHGSIRFSTAISEVQAVDEVRVGDRVIIKFTVDYGTLNATYIKDFTEHK